jgi:hypothetical protein
MNRPTVNITPIERYGRVLVGLIGVVSGIALLAAGASAGIAVLGGSGETASETGIGAIMEDDPLSPEERRLFNELEDVIYEELSVQVGIGRLDNPDGERQTAGLIADVVWSVFELRER